MIKQTLIDGDSSTCFYQDSMLTVPKKCEFIPIEDLTVISVVNNALDQTNQLRTLMRKKLQQREDELENYKKKFQDLQDKVNQAAALLDGKNTSRAKVLLKVNCEFLRKALPVQKDEVSFK